MFLADWRKEEFQTGEYDAPGGPCSFVGKKGRRVKMTWIFPGPEKFSQNGDLWPRPTETLSINIMV